MIHNSVEADALSSSRAPLAPRILIAVSIIISLTVSACLAWQLRVPITNQNTDFLAFYTAGKIVAAGNGSLLFHRSTLVNTPFTHAPYEALLFVPFAHLSYAKAVWCWSACSVLLAYLSLYFLLPLVPGVANRAALPILAMCIFLPLLIAEFNGQDSILTLFLFVICFRNLVRGHALIAGGVLALALCKPPLAIPMILLIVLTSRKRWPFLAGFIATGMILLLISIAAVGWSGVLAYPHFLVTYAGTADQFHVEDMPNVRGLTTWMFASHLAASTRMRVVEAVSLLLLALSAWCAYSSRTRNENEPLKFALFVTTTLLVGFHEYAYDLVLLFLPLLLVWNWSQGRGHSRLHQKLLAYCVPALVCASILSYLKPQIYALVIVLFFALICWELRSTRNTEPVLQNAV